mmetsp:Transcript_4536/g.14643  ORF Transcript_4536/g.14643 Transcript_4536/m.14643 type:complete len:260 (+) Transcript_4536:22-801(+)
MSASRPGRLSGKVAFVTGGATGIGAAIVKRFVQEGARVALLDLLEADAVVHEADPDGAGLVVAFKGSTADEDTVRESIAAAVAKLGRLDVLVNNAAAFVFGDVESVTSEDWDKVLSVNVKGYAFAMKHATPHLRRAGGGAVVNMGSISSFIAQPAFVPYNATKGAVVQMTRCAALDLSKYGIRVNAVCPGPIETRATMRHAASQGKTKDEIVEEMKGQLMIRRMGQPEEVANAVLFLASDEASFITATPLMVDGGYTGL